MDSIGLKIRSATILAGIAIALLAAIIVYMVVHYVFNMAYSYLIFGIMLVFILILDIIQYLISPAIIGRMHHLRKVDPQDPATASLYASLEKVCLYNNERVPELYIAETPIANAFAYGSILSGKRVAVTSGLLRILNTDEIEAVLAHEIGHLKHHDMALLMAIGLIPTVIFYFGYSILFTGGGRSRNTGSIFIIAMAMVGVSFAFNLMVLGVNRMRESYADVNSATTLPGASKNLQTALAKIVVSSTPYKKTRRKLTSSSSSMLMFSDMSHGEFKDHRALLEEWKHTRVPMHKSIFSDHPHPAKRIQMLEKIDKSGQAP